MANSLADIQLVVAHHGCPKAGTFPATMGRGRPVMVPMGEDVVKELRYFKCPLCGDEIAIKVVGVSNYAAIATVTEN